jgi:hypothetical protein
MEVMAQQTNLNPKPTEGPKEAVYSPRGRAGVIAHVDYACELTARPKAEAVFIECEQ